MIKSSKSAYKFGHITPEIVAKVVEVIRSANRGRYSAKEVFGAYNAVLQKNDPVDTCATCNISRVRELRNWLPAFLQSEAGAAYVKKHGVPVVADEVGTKNRKPERSVKAKALTPEEAGAKDYELAAGGVIRVFPNGLTQINGKKAKAGTYDLADGGTVTIPVGNKPATHIPAPAKVLTDGRVITTDEDGVVSADGEPLAAGTYDLADGGTVVVAPPIDVE